MKRLKPNITRLVSLFLLVSMAATAWWESRQAASAAASVSRLLSDERSASLTDWDAAFSSDWRLAINLLATSLASEDPVVATNAARAIQRCLDQWRVLDHADSDPRVETLAEELAALAESGNRFPSVTRDVVFRILRWPEEQASPSPLLGGRCNAILRSLRR